MTLDMKQLIKMYAELPPPKREEALNFIVESNQQYWGFIAGINQP